MIIASVPTALTYKEMHVENKPAGGYSYGASMITGGMNNHEISDMLNVKKLNKILNSGEMELVDLFYSVNTYKTKNMATENNIFQIVNVLIDVDYKKSMYKKLSNTQFCDMLEHDIFGQVVPTPSALVFTGNNIHLIYKLKYSVNGTDKAKILAKRVQKHLTGELKEFKADRNVNLTTLTRFIPSIKTRIKTERMWCVMNIIFITISMWHLQEISLVVKHVMKLKHSIDIN